MHCRRGSELERQNLGGSIQRLARGRELVVCSVKSVKENGAYLSLDTYPDREGFVFIGEIATGWVRNIRAHVREGQRLVAKVIGVKKDRDSITLSIKSVSEEREEMPCSRGRTSSVLPRS